MMSTFRCEPINRIGGESGLSLDDFLAPEISPQPQFSPQKHRIYLDTGRSAIYLALINIIKRGGKREVWLPRYLCPSVLLPFKMLRFKLNFYSCGYDLNSPYGLPEELDGETLFFIHYFGKKNQAVCRYRESMQKRCFFFVIEDCVQALLSRDIGTGGYSIYSFRKFFPLPDGGLLASDFPLVRESIAPADESFVSRRLIGKLIRYQEDGESFLDLFAQAEELIDRFIGSREMSFLSRYLLARTDAADTAEKRQNNYSLLSELLANYSLDHEFIHPLYSSLDPGEVPLGLPVIVDPARRDRLREFLSQHRIFCPVHWALEGLAGIAGSTELQLSRSLLTLPVDQGLDSYSMFYLFEVISKFMRGDSH